LEAGKVSYVIRVGVYKVETPIHIPYLHIEPGALSMVQV
jgi:hypothetical protein